MKKLQPSCRLSVYLFRFISVLLALLSIINGHKLPLCAHSCKCININNTELVKVICSKDVKPLIEKESTWINLENNQSYPYSEITLTDQNFLELNFTFPRSDVTCLNLTNNFISSIGNSVFKKLENMRILILSNNNLEHLSPEAFKGIHLPERYEPLYSLIELRMDHNRLHSLDANIFQHTIELQILDLSNNPLKVIDKSTLLAISSLPDLRELHLAYTQLKTLPDFLLHTLKHLSVLDLSGNPIDTVPRALVNSHNILTLFLNNTNFINLTAENGFTDIASIKNLHICHTQFLERIEKGALAGLRGLEELHISDNLRLTHLDAFTLAKINPHGGGVWPLLKKLHIGNNKLSYLDSDFLARWDALSELDIRGNPWTCECENQWMIDDLMIWYLRIDEEKASQVKCGAPIEMVDHTFLDLYERKYQMRCLDTYGAEPEKDAAMLVGVLAGVLVAIPVILFGIYAYQRRWFGLLSICDDSPAAYTRRYYSTTSTDDDF